MEQIEIKQNMGKMKIFKSDGKKWREKRDLALYREYTELTSVEGQGKTGVNNYLMRKYGIHSPSTIYVIIRRVEERIKAKI